MFILLSFREKNLEGERPFICLREAELLASSPTLVYKGGAIVILSVMSQAKKNWQGAGKDAVALHHAYGLSGPREEVLADVLQFAETALKLPYRGNPDVFVWQCDTLTVDDSRRVKEVQSRKAFVDRKVIIIAFHSATNEAQNALLKAVEEPTERTHIFLIVPRLDLLLPTVRSRLFTAEYTAHASSEAAKQAQVFLGANVGERLAIVKKIADDIADEKIGKNFALEFLNHLEQELWAKKKTKETGIFDEIALCRKYLSDRSASVRMLLEHIAVALPPTKL